VLVSQPEDSPLVSTHEGLERVLVAPSRRSREIVGLDVRHRLVNQGAKRPVLLHSSWNYTLNVTGVATVPVKAL
jgi:hypothetical protein